jgi:hypothetical protein
MSTSTSGRKAVPTAAKGQRRWAEANSTKQFKKRIYFYLYI